MAANFQRWPTRSEARTAASASAPWPTWPGLVQLVSLETCSLSGKESVKAAGSIATKHWPRLATWVGWFAGNKAGHLVLDLPPPDPRAPGRPRQDPAEDLHQQPQPVTLHTRLDSLNRISSRRFVFANLVSTGLLWAAEGHPAAPPAGQGRLRAGGRSPLPGATGKARGSCFYKQKRSKRNCWFKSKPQSNE